MLPNLSEESSQPRSAKRCLHQLIHTYPQFIIAGLPGGSNKTRPTDHRRGRPPRLIIETLLTAGLDRPKRHRIDVAALQTSTPLLRRSQSQYCQHPKENIEKRSSII